MISSEIIEKSTTIPTTTTTSADGCKQGYTKVCSVGRSAVCSAHQNKVCPSSMDREDNDGDLGKKGDSDSSSMSSFS